MKSAGGLVDLFITPLPLLMVPSSSWLLFADSRFDSPRILLLWLYNLALEGLHLVFMLIFKAIVTIAS